MKIPKNIALVVCLVSFALACKSGPSAAEAKALAQRASDSISNALEKELAGAIANETSSTNSQKATANVPAKSDNWFTNKAGSKLSIELSDDNTILHFKFKIAGGDNCDPYEFKGVAEFILYSAGAGATERSYYSYADESGCKLEFDLKQHSINVTVPDDSDCILSFGGRVCPWPEGTFK